MTIPTLRGLTDETANLPMLGKQIANLLSGGTSEIQDALRKAIAADPSIAENLGELSRNNPELYGALKLGKLGGSIAKTPRSEATTLKHEQAKATLTKTRADTTGQEIDNELSPIRKSVLLAQKTKLDLDIQDLQEAQKGFPGLNFKKAVDDFTNGQQSSDLQAVYSNPKAMPLFTQMLGYKKQGEQLASQEARADARLQTQFDLQALREDKQRTKTLLDQGKSFVLQSKVGTPETWAAYLDDPEIQAQAHNLIKNGLPKGQENDQNLINLRNIAAKREQDQNLSGVIERTKVVGQVNSIFKDIKSEKYGKNELPGVIQNLNQQLEVLASIGGRAMKVVPESQLATGSTMDWLTQKKYSTKPILIDATTRQPLDDNKIDLLAEQPSSARYSPQQINKAASDIAPYKGQVTWKQVIDKLKKEQPEMYQILKQRGDITEP